MPSFDALCNTNYSAKQWLQYYRNIWTRNLMGSMCDVQHDSAILAKDPNAESTEMVADGKGGARPKTFAERVEERKANAERALGIIAAIDQLVALSDTDLAAAMTSGSDFLKPAEQGVKSPLVSYTVQPGKTVTTDAGEMKEGATVMLDPTDQTTIDMLGEGLIKLSSEAASV